MTTMNLSRRAWLKVVGGAGLATLSQTSHLGATPPGGRPRQVPAATSQYSSFVLSLRPVGYWRLGEASGATAADSSGHQNNGLYHGSPTFGEQGAIRNDSNTSIGLDGRSYVEISSQSAFSIGAAGLTVQAWMRPDLLNFAAAPRAEYIYWLGKGETRAFEWGFRFYKRDSSRPNRISAYAWNAEGAEGNGAYFEEPIVPGRWINVVAVYQPPGNNTGVFIYRDGVLKDGPPKAPTLYRSYRVTPRSGQAPLRLGCRDLTSFLRGGLDEVAVYPRCLTAAEILKSHRLAIGQLKSKPLALASSKDCKSLTKCELRASTV